MKRIAIAALVIAGGLALAGENRFLGTLRSTGASVSNITNRVTGTLSDGGSGLVTDAFVIPTGAKITVDCDAEAKLLVDSLSVARSGSTKGLRVAATTLLPTSVGPARGTVDAGAGVPPASTAVVSVISTAADAGVNCDLWQRTGNE